mmetsp:Transcript_7524/g.12700  ORF Transcript_7524/g.12700 Transcript_7524/m.12700 type:complete len:314 (-) Transcript_7524:26-967(-)
MILDKGKVFGDLAQDRHKRDFKLITDYRATKQTELDRIKENRDQAFKEYMAKQELQAIIQEAEKYMEEIEEMHVKLQHLSLQIKELEDATEYLQEKKDELDEQKKATDEQNEDLERQLKAKEEANQKRLIAKLQRDKNPEIKELIQKEEQQMESNEDFNNKFREEREKLDQLLDEQVQLKETLKLTVERYEHTVKLIAVQDEELKSLRQVIEDKQKTVNGIHKEVEEARRVNEFEEEKNRKYAKANAALRAKLEFIESKYDYTSSAKNMSLEYFKDLMSSNQNVNSTMNGFTEKLSNIQKEIQSLEAMKNMFV